jgi:hypothetical protein
MRLKVMLGAVAIMLVAAGWSAGSAQQSVADFYLTIDAPSGELKITCSRGCDWPAERGNPPQTIASRCERTPCQVTVNGRGQIRIGMPLASTPLR